MCEELLVSLDSIEEDVAVLVTRDLGRWLVPLRFLPGDIAVGDVLGVSFSRDARATGELAAEVRDLQERLLRRTAGRSEKDG